MNKPKNTPTSSLYSNSSRQRRQSLSVPFGSGSTFVPRQHHQVKMIEDNHGSSSSSNSKYSNHELVNNTGPGTGVYLSHPNPKGPAAAANKKTTTETTLTSSTSVMMRHIPNGLRRMLIRIVDQHCIEENKKALRMLNQDDNSSPSESTTLSEYDFLYLPVDFKRNSNMGYAFINFTTSVAAGRFYNAFENFCWRSSTFQSPKIFKISKDGLVRRFKNSYFRCETDEFLPVLFSPPRNGSTPGSFPSLVGKRPKTITRKRRG
ncbi:hypothetical protein MKX01_018612 [Papaver californicum]|nr:hypothetical protein MKX01_018612 [Papaver californicum]